MLFRSFFFIALLLASFAGADRPNLVLLSVDTLRADFLGCYGGEWDITPNIDALAEESLLFEDAQCETPLTGPSFAAMFTSRYPRMVGAMRNGMRVTDDVTLVAEHIRDAGYHTFAAQSNWTLRGRLSGLDRGFAVYDESFEQRRWGILKGERRAEDLAKTALHLLAERPEDKPFFAWIHFTDPHAPYRHRRGFGPGVRNIYRMEREERVRVRYASEVAYTDHYIGKILEALPDNTLILFVADHGESLYEHGYLGHGRNIHQPSMHVPLMVRAPQASPGRSGAPVQTLDVGPTLLGLLGLPPLPGMLGRDIVNEEIPDDRPRFMETYGGAVPRIPGAKQFLRETSPLYQAVIQNGYKLIRPANRPSMLFYLPDDPGEDRNIIARNQALHGELNALLDLWEETHPRGTENVVDLTDEDMQALESLGYMN